MTQFDYLVPLVAIMIGLALADLSASFHRLVRAGRKVRWHWLPLAAAVFIILLTLEMWWGLRGFQVPGRSITIGMFLPFMVELIMLYLLASAVLPDEVPPEGVDLETSYLDVSRYFWLLLTGLVLIFLLHRIGAIWLVRGADSALKLLPNLIPNLVMMGVMISLAFTRRIWWHSLWLAVLPLLYLANLFGRQLI